MAGRMSIEAMKLALEALEKTHTAPGCEQWALERKACIALRTAIEVAEKQEPAPGYCKHCKQYTIEEPLPAVQREWVGLTDEQINQYDYQYRDLLYDVEKMLREANA